MVASKSLHLQSKMPDGVRNVLAEIKYPPDLKRKPFWSESWGNDYMGQ